MKFFIIAGKNALYTYEQKDGKWSSMFIEGSDSFPLNPNNVEEDTKAYLETLANEKNLGTTAMLEFEMLESPDKILNENIIKAFGDHIDMVRPLDECIGSVLKKLMRDKKLKIEKYGINYEGISYKSEDLKVIKGDFDLLGLTIHAKDIVEYIKTN